MYNRAFLYIATNKFSTVIFLVLFLIRRLNQNCSPFNNPTETYRYYSLPFCHEHSTEEEESDAALEQDVEVVHNYQGEKQLGAQRHKQRLGESIVGDRRESSPYEVSYDDPVDWRLLCKKHLVPSDIVKLKEAIHNNYFFEMFVEDLPMWGYIGDIADEDMIVGEMMEGSKTYLFTHLNFIIGQNNNQIVSAKVTTDVSQSGSGSTQMSISSKRFFCEHAENLTHCIFFPFVYTLYRWTEEWTSQTPPRICMCNSLTQ